MTSKHEPVWYAPIPSENVVVLPVYNHPGRRRRYCNLSPCLYTTATIILFSLLIYLIYPSDPTLQLSRIRLNHIKVNSSPKPTLDLSFSLTIKVYNRDFFSLDYDSLLVSVGYRGRELGLVRSEGGKVRARGSSYVDATLVLDGLEVIHDVIYLIEDLSKGIIPFDTVTQVKGDLGVLFFEIPIKVIFFFQILFYINSRYAELFVFACMFISKFNY